MGQRRRRWECAPALSVEVPLGAGAWAAARALGIDLSPTPTPREWNRRQQLQHELDQELAAPLIPVADPAAPG